VINRACVQRPLGLYADEFAIKIATPTRYTASGHNIAQNAASAIRRVRPVSLAATKEIRIDMGSIQNVAVQTRSPVQCGRRDRRDHATQKTQRTADQTAEFKTTPAQRGRKSMGCSMNAVLLTAVGVISMVP
jgi:hypothetical protein